MTCYKQNQMNTKEDSNTANEEQKLQGVWKTNRKMSEVPPYQQMLAPLLYSCLHFNTL